MKVRVKDFICKTLALMMVVMLVVCMMPMNMLSVKADTNTDTETVMETEANAEVNAVVEAEDDAEDDAEDNAEDDAEDNAEDEKKQELQISGEIFVADETQEDGKRGYEGAKVGLLTGSDTEQYVVTTDNNGCYTIVIPDGLSAGTSYKVKVTPGEAELNDYKVYVDETERTVSEEDVANHKINIDGITLAEAEKYAITTSVSVNGSENASAAEVIITDHNNETVDDNKNIKYGESRTLYVNPGEGYKVVNVTVNGSEIKGGCIDEKTGCYTGIIKNISENIEVVATLEEKTFVITCTVDENGKVILDSDKGNECIEITTSGTRDVTYTTEPYTISAAVKDNKYHITSFVVDDVEVLTAGDITNDCNEVKHTFENGIIGSHSIKVSSAIDEYKLTIKSSEGGYVKIGDNQVQGEQVVAAGLEPVLTVVPSNGMYIDSVTVNGEAISCKSEQDVATVATVECYTYTLGTVSGDMVVEVKFNEIPVSDEKTEFDEAGIKVSHSGEIEVTDAVKYYSNNGITVKAPENKVIQMLGWWYGSEEYIDYNYTVNHYRTREGSAWAFWTTTGYNLKKPVEFIIDRNTPVLEVTGVSGGVEAEATDNADVVYVVSKNEAFDEITLSGKVTDENLLRIVCLDSSEVSDVNTLLAQESVGEVSYTTEKDSNFTVSNVKLTGDENTFYLYAIDKAHNISLVQTVKVLRDGTAPSVEKAVFAGDFNENNYSLATNEKVNLTLNVQDSIDASGAAVNTSGIQNVSVEYSYKEGKSGERKTVTREFSDTDSKVNQQMNELSIEIPVVENETIYLSTLKVTLEDKVGNTATVGIESIQCCDKNETVLAGEKIVIDGSTPEVVSVSTEADYVEELAEGNNKKWYKEIPDLKVNASDSQKDVAGSGLATRQVYLSNGNMLQVDVAQRNEEIVSLYTKDAEDFNAGATATQEDAFVVEGANLKNNTEKDFAGVKEGANTIRVEYADNAGNMCQNEVVWYIDTCAPQITNFEIEEVESNAIDKILKLVFGNYYNSKIQITVSANDNECTEKNHYDIADVSGVKTISLLLDGKVVETKEVDECGQAIFVVPYDEILGEDLYLDAYVTAVATDYVGNTSEETDMTTGNSDMEDGIKSSSLMIETVKPEIGIKAETAGYVNDEGVIYSNTDAKFEITAKDVNSGLRTVTVNIYAADENGELVKHNVLEESYYDGEAISQESGADEESNADEETNADDKIECCAVKEKTYEINTSMVEDAIDGIYHLEVIVVDLAGNESTEKRTVYKDEDVPVIKNYSFVGTGNAEGNGEELSVEETAYGFYFREETSVTITATDVIDAAKSASASGVESIQYYFVNADGTQSAPETVAVNDKNQIVIMLQPGFKGQIYARAIDRLGNTASEDGYVNPNGVIVESSEMHESETHISFEAPKTAYVDSKENPLYATDTTVKVRVTDTYSGIKEIAWSVAGPTDGDRNQSGTLEIDNSGNFTETSNSDGWNKKSTESNLVTALEKDIVVANNSNDIRVYVKMTDRAGNISEEEMVLSIDKTIPVIEVTFDNETPDAEFVDHYKENRTATITVQERNFKAENINCQITNSDGTLPTISAWSTSVNQDAPDMTIHVATIVFQEDGDYTLSISGKDAADNEAAKTEEFKFTIDKTNPEILVTYNDNVATNGNYYDAERLATIQIKEHNFDEKRVKVSGTATVGGEAIAFPNVSGWTKNGDIYTATILCSQDALYQFNIEYTDKAGNKAETYVGEEFYVDMTMPEIEIRDISDMSANNGVVAPTVVMSDMNYDTESVSIELVGASRGAVTPNGTYSAQANGQIFNFADFEHVQENDDIYTLTVTCKDMAGNETVESVVFSVNRFGSVYVFEDSLESIRGTYIQQEVDVKLTEVNVDSLEHDSIKVVVDANGTPRDLVEGADYTVEMSGGNGSWYQYDYTIDKSLFEGDGRYIVTLYSEDEAGNVNENIDESKQAEISFGVDKTAPVVVPIDIESNEQYAVDTKEATVTVNDNLVLDTVEIYVGNEKCEYSQENDTYKFMIPSSSSNQDIKILATDAAGNCTQHEVENVLVTTNAFVRWYNNKKMVAATVGGTVTVAGGGAGVSIALRRRKIRVKLK